MKALVLKEYMQLDYIDVPDPEINDDEVLIRVKAVGICGSDVHGIDGSTGRRIPPLIMGHEASGIIEMAGSNVSEWKPGDRVTFDSTIYRLDDWYSRKGKYNLSDNRMVLGVSTDEYRRNGAFAEYVAVPQHILYRIPDNVSFVQAAMVEPAAVALHAIELTPFSVNDIAVVTGTGMIGLFIVQLLKIAGCGKIIALDIDDDKLMLAKDFGADKIFNTDNTNVISKVLGETNNRGADIVFEAIGISQTVNTAINAVRKGGTVTLIGNLSQVVEIPLQTVVSKQLCLQGSCAINGEYSAVLDMISSGNLRTDKVLSVEAPLSEGASWFKRLYNKEKGLIKVVLVP